MSAAQISQLQQSGGAVTNPRQVNAGFFDQQSFELMMRIAKGFATSSLVPKEFQNNIGNCMIALNLANRLNADPLMTMQNLVVIHGRPTWSAQYLISTANMCGRFSAIRFEFFGDKKTDDWGCRAWATEHSTGEKLVGSDVTIAIAKKEGWYGKNGSKWQSIPQQMLMYRAGAWWVRAYAPELSMGLQTTEEVVDVYDAKKSSDGSYSVNINELRSEDPEDGDDALEASSSDDTEKPKDKPAGQGREVRAGNSENNDSYVPRNLEELEEEPTQTTEEKPKGRTRNRSRDGFEGIE